MTSTISSAKTKNPLLGMMKWSIKESLPVLIVYSFLLMVSFPMFIILLKQNNYNFNYIESQVFDLGSFIAMCFSIVIGVMMFSIYHNKRSVDLFASFPIKRHTLFLAKYFSGLIILVVPLVVFIITGLLVSLQVNSETVFFTFFSMAGIVLGVINIFSMIAFLAMICGSVVDTLVTFGVVNIGVISCIFLGITIISSLLPGYSHLSIDFYELPVYMAFFLLCPVSMPFIGSSFISTYYWEYDDSLSSFMNSDVMKIEIIYMAIWLLLSVVYVVAAIMIAKKRKNENVQNGFIYTFPKVVIQVIGSLAAAMILGWFFAESFSYYNDGFKTMLMFMLGALIGSFVAFLIVTLIYNRGTKRFVESLPVFACSFVAVGIFYLMISLGLVGVSYVPKAEDVKAVAVYADGDYRYDVISDDLTVMVSKDNSFEEVDYFIEDKEFINSTVNLHQTIVDGLHDAMGTFFNFYGYFEVYHADGYEPYSIKIVYELNNGKKVSKAYSSGSYIYENMLDEYNAVASNDTYKQCYKLAMCSTADEANVMFMDIYPHQRYTNTAPKTLEEYFDEYSDEYYSDENYIEDTTFELNDSKVLNSIYISLREEYLADKNIAETLKAGYPQYVEPTDDNFAIYDEVSYTIDIGYSSDLGAYAYEKKLEQFDYNYYDYIVDPNESYTITKETYPKTWELINSYFEQEEDCTALYLYPNNRTNS